MRTSKGVAVVLLLLKWATSGSSGQTLTTLYQFGSSISNGIALDGSIPEGALVQGSDSNFYGTTHDGGTYGWGTIFRISPSGSYTTLYSFANSSADGANPLAGLVLGRDGNFYGTTLGVRTNVSHGTGLSGNGAVFRISPSGSLTNLHFFDFSDGSNPNTGLIQGSDGNFYGTTYGGGMNAYGTVFKINPSGSFTSLYSFVGYPTDGERPWKLAQGTDGSLYGTTYVGGSNYAGTVFAISPSGTYTSLYSFIGYPKDGYLPDAGLVQGSDGNFYGTTYEGGTNGYGTVFRISPAGKETIIHSFAAIPGDGYQPSAELVQGSDGNLYGTTTAGTVFWISLAGSFSISILSAVVSIRNGWCRVATVIYTGQLRMAGQARIVVADAVQCSASLSLQVLHPTQSIKLPTSNSRQLTLSSTSSPSQARPINCSLRPT